MVKMFNRRGNRTVKRLQCSSKFTLLVIGASVVLLVLSVVAIIFIPNWDLSEQNKQRYGVYEDFLIDGLNCKIPNLNPFAEEAMAVFTREKYEACSQLRPLSSIAYGPDTIKLIIHKELKRDHLAWWQNDFSCCYQRIIRSGKSASSADNEVDFSECKFINSNHILDTLDEFIIVTCTGFGELFMMNVSSVIYQNAHAIITNKSKVVEKIASKRDSENKISVLMMGIDSISRLNLIRGMPETTKYLEDNGWFEMRGYNKIGDNTFPNIMAILTGQNRTVIDQVCNWRKVGELEKCEFIWSGYDSAGYVTAYAEDESSINTFNYYKTGFVNEPTDYYLRPFALGAEMKLNIREKHNSKICLGYQHYADHVYQYMLDYALKFKDDASFGLFWTNSFSHEDLSMSSAMDTRVLHYLNELKTLQILDSSIVIFFSDHGMRFGPIRKEFIGWLEERLPFFYIWLPEKFKNAHPEIVKNLNINRDRLSSPYDVYLTLKHILLLSGGHKHISLQPDAVSCPECKSLFEEHQLDRSCSDAGISKHWCTCVEFQEVDITSKYVNMAVNNVIETLNSNLLVEQKCAKLKLNEIHSVRKSTHHSSVDYLVSFSVLPSYAELEATVRCDEECEKINMIGSASRLNRYGNQSYCVSDSNLRKYCFCQ